MKPMTLADLIRELQELNVDPNTPVRFYANEYDAENPLINLVQIGGPKRWHREVGIHVHSPEIEDHLNECYEGFC